MSKIPKLHYLGIVVVLVLLATILHPSFVAGQNASSQPPSNAPVVPAQSAADLTLDKLRLKRSGVEASQDLDKASKDSAIKLLDQAIGFRESLDELNRQSKALSRQIKTAPQRIKTIQSELSKPFQPPEAVEAMAAKRNALALEQRLQKEQAQLAAAKDLLAGWNDQLNKQKDLLEHLPKNIAAAKARLRTVNEELQSQLAAGDPALVTESRRLLLRVEQLKLKAEVKVYEQQLNSYEMFVSLLRIESDLAARELAGREALVKAWQAQVAKRLQRETTKVREEAEEAKDKTPELAAEVKEQYDINISSVWSLRK
jgi:hypothetical protein